MIHIPTLTTHLRHPPAAVKMRRALLIAVIALQAACGRARTTAHDVSLAGTWNVELTRGLLPWRRTKVHGQIHLAPWKDSQCDAAYFAGEPDAPLCETHVKGTYTILLAALVGEPRTAWEPDAEAIAQADGTVRMEIGGCCDRGEIAMEGRVGKNRITGSWQQRFLSGGTSGRFVLRRTAE